jgi:hypothetical protein
VDENNFINIDVVIIKEEEGGKLREFLNNSTIIIINVAIGIKRERTCL